MYSDFVSNAACGRTFGRNSSASGNCTTSLRINVLQRQISTGKIKTSNNKSYEETCGLRASFVRRSRVYVSARRSTKKLTAQRCGRTPHEARFRRPSPRLSVPRYHRQVPSLGAPRSGAARGPHHANAAPLRSSTTTARNAISTIRGQRYFSRSVNSRTGQAKVIIVI